ncbi:hypothetical protein ACHAXR_000830, partial [Thalassiosira sp. AJA248-18]
MHLWRNYREIIFRFRLSLLQNSCYHLRGWALLEGTKKRVEAGDANAMHTLGCQYSRGHYGLAQDSNTVLELWHWAAKLGCVYSHY